MPVRRSTMSRRSSISMARGRPRASIMRASALRPVPYDDILGDDDEDDDEDAVEKERILYHRARIAGRRSRERSDEEALQDCVADAALYAFGCVFVEAWVLSDDGTKLIRPPGGHWMEPTFANSLPSEELMEKAWILEGTAVDCPPGAGLAGTMAEEGGLNNNGIVHWRQILDLLDDPFVQRLTQRRMGRLVEVGIGIVAAVPFNFEDEKGMVLFHYRTTVDVELLRTNVNERYMRRSADLIGATYSIRKARDVANNLRDFVFRQAMRKARGQFLGAKRHRTLASMVVDKDFMARVRLEAEREREEAMRESMLKFQNLDKQAAMCTKQAVEFGIEFGKAAVKRADNSRRKWRGAKMHGPPHHSLGDTLFNFVGIFIVMLSVINIGGFVEGIDERFRFSTNWYASTLCIVYAMTPAPVGQPRQIFAAHLWNMLVGLACRLIILPVGYKNAQALSVALSVAGQALMGIIHPPATGMSVAFVTNTHYNTSTMLSVMLADVVVVAISVAYINMSNKKQFPLFWLGLGWQGSGGTMGYLKSTARKLHELVKGMSFKDGSFVTVTTPQQPQQQDYGTIPSIPSSLSLGEHFFDKDHKPIPLV